MTIKDFDVDMEVKNNGIELAVADTKGKHLGDIILTKTQVVWCAGRIRRENGKAFTWAEFIELLQDAEA